MTICDLSLHQGSTESRKNLKQKFPFQIGTLNPHGTIERLFIQLIQNSVAPRGETGEEDDLFPSLPSFFSHSFARFIFCSHSTI